MDKYLLVLVTHVCVSRTSYRTFPVPCTVSTAFDSGKNRAGREDIGGTARQPLSYRVDLRVGAGAGEVAEAAEASEAVGP